MSKRDYRMRSAASSERNAAIPAMKIDKKDDWSVLCEAQVPKAQAQTAIRWQTRRRWICKQSDKITPVQEVSHDGK